MIKVNIAEAKAGLSRIVDAALRGERVVLCRRNRELARDPPAPEAAGSTAAHRNRSRA